jgi:hypothetical protein
MPGRMGGEQTTVKNVWVYKIEPARNLMWVKGQVLYMHCLFTFANLNSAKGPLQCLLGSHLFISEIKKHFHNLHTMIWSSLRKPPKLPHINYKNTEIFKSSIFNC